MTSAGFKEFLLRPELLRSIIDCGFEHPSEGIFFKKENLLHFHFILFKNILKKYYIVQHQAIPRAVLGVDILCQAKSGMGKTAVFVYINFTARP